MNRLDDDAVQSIKDCAESLIDQVLSGDMDYYRAVHLFRSFLLTTAFECSKGSKAEAARLLNLKRTTFDNALECAMNKNKNRYYEKEKYD